MKKNLNLLKLTIVMVIIIIFILIVIKMLLQKPMISKVIGKVIDLKHNSMLLGSQEITIPKLDIPDEGFNHLKLRYSSTQPVKLKVIYVVNNEEIEDYFYLEEATEGIFNGLIKQYLEGNVATDLVSISVETCTGIQR